MWLQPSAIVLMMVLQTCVAGRFERLERRLELKLKSFQASVEVRLDATEGYFDTLADRVSKLESIVNKSDTDIVLTRSNGSRNEPSIEYTKPELNEIQNTLSMYKTSFIKQKKEMNDVKFDIFTYLGNLSSDVKTKLALHVVGQIEDNNKALIALNSQVRYHIANETESLEVFKTSILQDVNETRERVRNETTELEKNVEKLIGKATEVVGIIDEQRSTIKDSIMVTIRALHSSWSGWSAWSDCPQSCQSGSRSRHRSCDVHPPVTDGICIGNDTDTEECIIHEFCILPRCPDMRVENGEIQYIGDRARYTYAHVNCNDGYTVGKDGVETVECLGSLQWESILHCYMEGCQAPIDTGDDAFYQNGATYTVTHKSCSGGNVPSFKGQITCVNGHWSEQVICLNGAIYRIIVKTADKWFAATDGEVYLYMYGSKGNSGKIILHGEFETGDVDLTNGHFVDVGKISKIQLGVKTRPFTRDSWIPESVLIEDVSRGEYYKFVHGTEIDDTSIFLYPAAS